MELRGGGKGQDNNRVSTILKYVTAAQVEDTMICTESS
jgi:hypothetical protein